MNIYIYKDTIVSNIHRLNGGFSSLGTSTFAQMPAADDSLCHLRSLAAFYTSMHTNVSAAEPPPARKRLAESLWQKPHSLYPHVVGLPALSSTICLTLPEKSMFDI